MTGSSPFTEIDQFLPDLFPENTVPSVVREVTLRTPLFILTFSLCEYRIEHIKCEDIRHVLLLDEGGEARRPNHIAI